MEASAILEGDDVRPLRRRCSRAPQSGGSRFPGPSGPPAGPLGRPAPAPAAPRSTMRNGSRNDRFAAALRVVRWTGVRLNTAWATPGLGHLPPRKLAARPTRDLHLPTRHLMGFEEAPTASGNSVWRADRRNAATVGAGAWPIAAVAVGSLLRRKGSPPSWWPTARVLRGPFGRRRQYEGSPPGCRCSLTRRGAGLSTRRTAGYRRARPGGRRSRPGTTSCLRRQGPTRPWLRRFGWRRVLARVASGF